MSGLQAIAEAAHNHGQRRKEMTNGNNRLTGYQVWIYTWSDGFGPIPDHVWRNKVHATKSDAELAWYDSDPGRNDRCCYIKVRNGVAMLALRAVAV